MKSMFRAALLVCIAASPVWAAAAEKSVAFDDKASLDGWQVKGDVAIDAAKGRDGKGAALKVGVGGQATLKLRDANDSGVIELWVYDDMAVPKNTKAYRVGPRWGLLQADGRVFAVGELYARYLSGDKTYCTSDYGGKSWFNVRYLGECRRKKGWHKWTFNMDPDKGLIISLDGKDVNARRKRFDWNTSKVTGFVGVVLYGDTGKGTPHTLWADDLTVKLGGPMKVKPVPPPPPPPVVPEKDPAEENPATLLDAVKGKHPRLLFGAEDIPALKAFAKGKGKPFFDEMVKYRNVCKAPTHRKFLSDATDGQRQGLWRMPTVALHYVLTGDKKSLEATVGFMKMLLALKHWETGKELDSGMSKANIAIGAALAYDWTYDALEPAFREAFRKKLILQARAQYHGGHLNKNRSVGYWQGDPANNHRWHRNAGMALSVLTAYEGNASEDWILKRTHEDLQYVAKWLPPDGTSHEGPGYLIFGGAHLTLALQASDRCLGTKYLDQPFYKNTAAFRLHTLAPGMRQSLPFGDAPGMGGYCNFLFKAASHHQRKDELAGLLKMRELNPGSFWLGWMSLVWLDPAQAGGSVDKLPKTVFFPDVGVMVARDGWKVNDVAAMFKCGPFGGYKLNEFRNKSNFKYINVAHDDPDANTFILHAKGAMLAETDGYSKHKQSSNHNTILINRMGQMSVGRPEGGGWTQPGRGDMTKMAVVTAYKDAGDVVVVEGEAAGSYLKYTDRKTGRSRPGLSRYRRTFVWVKGSYILVLDDIRAPSEVEVTWLMQGPTLEEVDKTAGKYRLKKDKALCAFQILADQPLASKIAVSTADNRGKPLGWQQLQATAKTKSLRVLSAYNPWGLAKLDVAFKPAGQDSATITVTGPKFKDTWGWQAATGKFSPSTLEGERKGGFAVMVDEEAAPPKPE